jgi:AcrR family transcriptional regulator
MAGKMSAQTKPNSRDRVLEAARKLFFAKGLDATSIAEICKASGVSNGSLFHHFGTKEAIGLAIFLEVRREYWRYVLGAMEAADTVPDAAEASIRAAFRFQREHPQAFAFMLDTSAAPWVLQQTTALRDLNAEFSQRAMAWAAPHVMAGRLPMLSVHTFGAFLFGLPQWIARETRAGLSVPDTERCIEELAMLMRRLFNGAP